MDNLFSKQLRSGGDASRRAARSLAAIVMSVLSMALCEAAHSAGGPPQAQAQETRPAPQATPRMPDNLRPKPSAEEMERWRRGILKVPKPGRGCFTANYPDTGWHEIPCRTPPHLLYPPRRPGLPRAQQVGGQAKVDLVSVWQGGPTEAEGSFDSMTGVTSECLVQCPNQTCPVNPSCTGQPTNDFSLQLNTNPLGNPSSQPPTHTNLCSGSQFLNNTKTPCQGWEQFVYAQSSNCSGCTGDGFIQYWLLNWGPPGASCPNPAASASSCGDSVQSGQWCPFQFSNTSPVLCVMNANNSVAPPTEPITSLNELIVTGDSAGGSSGTDSVTVWEGGIPYTASGLDNFPDLASLWQGAEYNVFGNAGSSEAIFNNGATIHVRNAVSSGSSSGPGCEDDTFTGESNNLTLVNTAPAAVVGSLPALLFSESNPAAAGFSATCDDATSVSPTAPAPVTPTIVNAHIIVATGNDDARSDTELWATINGEQPFCLKPSNNANSDGVCDNGGNAKDQNGKQSWDNWTTSTQNFNLTAPQPISQITTLTIRLLEHNSTFETDDNWDIQGVTVVLTDTTGASTTVFNLSNPHDGNNCLARLKGSPNSASAVFGLNGTNSHLYAGGDAAGHSTTCSNNGG
jgi:hypothetical protein